MSTMKNRAIIFVFAAFYYVAAAPVQDEDALEVLIQRNLEDDDGSQYHGVLDPASPDEEQPSETQRLIKETQSTEEESAVEEQENDKVEIQKFKIFKSLLGKALKVLKRKLRRRSKSDQPMRRKDWDLLSNILGILGFRLDPTLEENVEEQDTEDKEMEKFGEEAAAEIEGLRSLLKNALRIINRKLKPRQRTEDEDRQALKNPTNWRDLGRYFLQILQDRLNKGKGTSEPQEEAELEGLFPDTAIDDPQGDQMAEAEYLRKVRQRLLQLLRRFRRRYG